MSVIDSKFIQWKKIYQLTSGTYYNENEKVVKERLLSFEKEIQTGLGCFKKPSSNANEELEKLLKEKEQERLIPFTQKLFKFLDLDVTQTFELLCYYLVNEYRGSASSLQNFVSNESLMIKLLNDIWFFYSLERMTMLKVVKCVLEYHENPDHPYKSAFKALLDKIGLENLRKSFIDQFETLVKDIHQAKHSQFQGDVFNSALKLQHWSERKFREINEILQIIQLIIHFDSIKPDEVEKLLDICKIHAFGNQNQFLNPSNSLHMDLIQKVNYSEISVLMLAFSKHNVEDVNWMNTIIDKIDEKVISMHHHQEHGPILLSWMVFKLSSKKNDTTMDICNNYGKLGAKALQLNVFGYLHKIVTHKQSKDKSLVSKNLHRCIYDNLDFLCELFNADGSMAQHPMIFELFSELLKLPMIAKDFCKSENSSIRTLFEAAVQNFPHEFMPLSMLANSLTTASLSSYSWIMNYLQNLKVYAEQPLDPVFELRRDETSQDEDAFLLLNNYQPFSKINDFVIPADSSVIVRDEKGKFMFYFITKLNYFNALHHEINELLNCVVTFTEIKNSRIQRLVTGINLLAAVIKRIDNPEEISNEMIHPTEMVFDIIDKFKVFQHPSMDLMSACVNVCAELLPFFSDEIFRRFVNLNIAPKVTVKHENFKAYANRSGFESGLIGYYLINIENTSGKYCFLKSYFNFLEKCSKLNNHDVYAIELPGLMLILEVFNGIHMWNFKNEQERIEILLFIYKYIHNILTISNEEVKEDKSKKLMRDICVYSLLYLNSASALLRIVSLGNAELQFSMQNESNWTALEMGSSPDLLVIFGMRILMRLLPLRGSIIEDMDQLSPLEQMIYTQPKQRDTLKIIPIVANYMAYPFNRRFSVLACRLLRRFAIEFQSSLTACLDLEPDQVRMLFLQRLRDELESEDLKISILDFVNACIDKQPGLTEAFFKVSYDQGSRNNFFIKRTSESENMCDGILTYMEEFLETVEKDPSQTTNDQLKRIMSLFHSLWKQGLQSLVSTLLKKPNFWSSLCSPILTTPIDNYQYSQLLNIMGIELFKLRKSDENNEGFRKVIEKFLSKEIFTKWLDVAFKFPALSLNDSNFMEDTPEWLARLQSFKDFLVLVMKRKNIISIPNDSCKLLLDKSLEALVYASKEMENGNDMRPFIIFSDLYLIVLNDQEQKYTNDNKEDCELLKNIENLLRIMTTCYDGSHKRSKDSILAIAIKILDLESDEIKNYPGISSNFVRYNLEMICNEFFTIENEIKGHPISGQLSTTILTINLLKKLLLIGDDFYGNCKYWFNYYKIFNRILSVLSLICQKSEKLQITGELLDLLIVLAKRNYSSNIIYCDVGDYIWMNLIIPKNSNEWNVKDWWNIYTKGIQLVKILLEKEGFNFIKDALFFLGIHEQYLIESLGLAKHSLEKNAMVLIMSTLELLGEIVKYEKMWSVDYQSTVYNLMRNTQTLLEHAVSLLQRPKTLKSLTEPSKRKLEELSDSMISQPSDDFVTASNNLIEIITLSSICLLHFSPKLLNLLCDVEFDQSHYQPFIEVQFGAPKLNSTNLPQLSYGTVLSAVALLIKALNLQQFQFKHQALNNIPKKEGGDEQDNDTVTMMSISESAHLKALNASISHSPSSPRRTFSKSLSISSMTNSIVQPSNELLSHLDSRVCINALEFLLTLLASQSLLALKAPHLSSREKQLIRRELSTELHSLHDLVKKKILKDSQKSPLHRLKMGIYVITNNVEEEEDYENQEPQPGPSKSTASTSSAPVQRRSKDLRVNVIRKQHLQQKFEIPQTFSPIAHYSSDHGPIESTPIRGNAPVTTSTSIKRVGFDLSSIQHSKFAIIEDDEPYAVNRGDPSFTGLSYVKFVEEDYFQMLSNIFSFICQNEN